jgi:hypothetical protein
MMVCSVRETDAFGKVRDGVNPSRTTQGRPVNQVSTRLNRRLRTGLRARLTTTARPAGFSGGFQNDSYVGQNALGTGREPLGQVFGEHCILSCWGEGERKGD